MNVYWATRLEGASRSLESFDVTTMSVGDLVVSGYSDSVYFYLLRNTPGTTEYLPFTLIPTVNPDNYFYEAVTLGVLPVAQETQLTSDQFTSSLHYSSAGIPALPVSVNADASSNIRIQTLTYEDNWTIYSRFNAVDSWVEVNSEFGAIVVNEYGVWDADHFVGPETDYVNIPPTYQGVSHQGNYTSKLTNKSSTWVIDIYEFPWNGIDDYGATLIDTCTLDPVTAGIDGTAIEQYLLHEESETMFFGISDNDGGNGAVVIYKKVGGVWTFSQTITGTLQFGYHVTTGFDRNIIAQYHNDGGTETIIIYDRPDFNSLFAYSQTITTWTEMGSGIATNLGVSGNRIYLACPWNDYYGRSFENIDTGCVVWFYKPVSTYVRGGVYQNAGAASNHLTTYGLRFNCRGRVVAWSNGTDNAISASCQSVVIIAADTNGDYLRNTGFSYSSSYIYDNSIYIQNGFVYSRSTYTGDPVNPLVNWQTGITYVGSENAYSWEKVTGPTATSSFYRILNGFLMRVDSTYPKSYMPAMGIFTDRDMGVITSDTNRFDLTGISTVAGIEVDTIFPYASALAFRYLVSFDGRTTWTGWSGGNPYAITDVIGGGENYVRGFTEALLNMYLSGLDLSSYSTMDIVVTFPWYIDGDITDFVDLSVLPSIGLVAVSLVISGNTAVKQEYSTLSSIGIETNASNVTFRYNDFIDITNFVNIGINYNNGIPLNRTKDNLTVTGRK